MVRARAEPDLLRGKVVLVTRPADRSEGFVNALDHLGARAIIAPTIEIVPARSAALTRALRDVAAGRFAWITLTSRATVEMLSGRLDPRAQLAAKVAAIGEGTAAAFPAGRDATPTSCRRPSPPTGLARAFPRGQGRVLCARADIAPEGLEDALAAKGWTPTRVDAYRTRMPRTLPREARDALRAGAVDAVTFTSASTVRGFVGALGTVKGTPKVVCIGPVTAREARDHGFVVHAVAKPHTFEGLIAALERVFTPRGSRSTDPA